MQLVAYGAQDIYLTGNPQITFFKVVYRRHTNFSMESIEQTPNGQVQFGNRATYTVSRNGDLVHKMYFEINPAQIFAGSAGTDATKVCSYFGNNLLKEVSLEIGGQLIDKHHREWLSSWADLTEKNDLGSVGSLSTVPGASDGAGDYTQNDALVVKDDGGAGYGLTDFEDFKIRGAPTRWQRSTFNITGSLEGLGGATNVQTRPTAINKAFVPLQFWFNRNPGLALPLIALQYHEVKVIADFCGIGEIGATATATAPTTNTLTSNKCKLWADYIYLDTDERRRFAQVSHEYLIEQVQREVQANATTFTMNFNHPVKEIIWGATPTLALDSDSSSLSLLGKVSTGSAANDAANEITIKLNGHERFSKRCGEYFSRCQVNQHHTGFGGVVNRDSINVYSFALKPEEHQPSGTCNFSRIDSAQLVYDKQTTNSNGITIFAVNYNVLRIMSGMGGLAYSN